MAQSVKHGVRLAAHIDYVWLVKYLALLVAVFVS